MLDQFEATPNPSIEVKKGIYRYNNSDFANDLGFIQKHKRVIVGNTLNGSTYWLVSVRNYSILELGTIEIASSSDANYK